MASLRFSLERKSSGSGNPYSLERKNSASGNPHGLERRNSSPHPGNPHGTTSNLAFQPTYKLLKLLLTKHLYVVSALCDSVSQDVYDEVARHLVNLFDAVGECDRLLKWGIKKEIKATPNAETLFRGTSMTTKMVSYFCKREGSEYLKQILGPSIRMFCIDDVSIEVDPLKAEKGENVETNSEMLLGLSRGLSDHIFRSVNLISTPMRQLFCMAQEEVVKVFPEHKHRVVGGFYFLRFLCPALVTPEHFGLIDHTPSPKSRRSLILMSKIQQNLANDVEFGEKEPYMLKINPYIVNNQVTMCKFLDEISVPTSDHKKESVCSEEQKNEALQNVVKHIVMCKEKIRKALEKINKVEVYDELNVLLENYKSGTIVKE
eukprot:Phypoly_transcript_09544.p1 GENE.Phypoly_transcript_09544~~Phypoly_transcript_09544.p1  ORF type:complete len:375 (+),score=53.97 Phypoly_transcript_09544:237-1361(+)